MLDDSVIKSIKEISNRKEVIDKLESHVAFPLKVENWMVGRVLYSWLLFLDEYYKEFK
jgi:hypothetical protein